MLYNDNLYGNRFMMENVITNKKSFGSEIIVVSLSQSKN
jgi:hypothetical protein